MTTDFQARKLTSKTHIFPIEAAAGCDLLILTLKTKSKDRSLRQRLQDYAKDMRPTNDCRRVYAPPRRGILPRLFSVAPAAPACLERCLRPTDAPKPQAPY
jgi:hypothetical protein